eukprot:gene5742-11611_t
MSVYTIFLIFLIKNTSSQLPELFQSFVLDNITEQSVWDNYIATTVSHRCNSTEFSEEYKNSCMTRNTANIRSVKIARLYNKINELNAFIANHTGNNEWMWRREGFTSFHFDKMDVMQTLSDDPRVKTICEIGFNTGYSAMNFLIANPAANVISFDIFYHFYASSAVQGIHSLFPDRELLVIAGDSKHTVPMFVKLVDKPLCNLIFIDGGHTPEQFTTDLLQMKALADPTYHRIIVDDIEQLPLEDVWVSLIENNTIKHHVAYEADARPCMQWDIHPEGTHYVFDFDEERCQSTFDILGRPFTWKSRIAIGEYIFP